MTRAAADTVLAVLTADGPVLADAAAPLLPADDLGVLRGESVFETLRLGGGRPAFLDAHLTRMARSAARVDVALPDAAALAGLAACAAQAWTRPEGVLRLVATKGAPGVPGTVYALLTPVPDAAVAGRAGVHVVTLALGVPAGLRAQAPWLLGGVKSTSYAVNMAALREAEARGAQDALLVSSDGEVLEGPTSTCLWVADGVLCTPPAEDVGTLPGTTAEVLLALHDGPVEVRRATLAELREASEVMLVSSVRGLAPVLSLDAVPVADGRPGPVTRRLSAAFEARITQA